MTAAAKKPADAARVGSSFVALLRGINVGGRNPIRMPELVECFSDAGYGEISTYLQSGNVLFSAARKNGPKLEAEVEAMLEQRFGTPLLVVIRSRDELAQTIESAPSDHGSPKLRSDVFFLSTRSPPRRRSPRCPNCARASIPCARSWRDLLLACGGEGDEDPHPEVHGDAHLPAGDRAHLAHLHPAAREARRRRRCPRLNRPDPRPWAGRACPDGFATLHRSAERMPRSRRRAHRSARCGPPPPPREYALAQRRLSAAKGRRGFGRDKEADMVPEINYWAVLLATASSMAVGAIWYARGVLDAGVGEARERRHGSPGSERRDAAGRDRAR